MSRIPVSEFIKTKHTPYFLLIIASSKNHSFHSLSKSNVKNFSSKCEENGCDFTDSTENKMNMEGKTSSIIFTVDVNLDSYLSYTHLLIWKTYL